MFGEGNRVSSVSSSLLWSYDKKCGTWRASHYTIKKTDHFICGKSIFAFKLFLCIKLIEDINLIIHEQRSS